MEHHIIIVFINLSNRNYIEHVFEVTRLKIYLWTQYLRIINQITYQRVFALPHKHDHLQAAKQTSKGAEAVTQTSNGSKRGKTHEQETRAAHRNTDDQENTSKDKEQTINRINRNQHDRCLFALTAFIVLLRIWI